MASRLMYRDIASLDPSIVVIGGSFAPNGSSAVAATSIKGKGIAAVSRTGTGEFEVTLSDAYADILAVVPSLQLNAAADSYVQLTGAVTPSTTKKFKLTVITAGSAADVSANANNRIHFAILAKNTAL